MRWFGSSKATIEALVEAHYAALYRYAYRLSGSAQEAEDLTQETFCAAQGKLVQLREPDRAKSWSGSRPRPSTTATSGSAKECMRASSCRSFLVRTGRVLSKASDQA